MLKHCSSLKTTIPNSVAFFLSLGIVISCIRKMSFSVTSAKQEFTPAIVSLSTSREVNRLLEIPTSPSLYMLIIIRAGRRRVKDSRPFFFFVVSRWYGGLAKSACGFINKMADTILSEILAEGWFENEKSSNFSEE